MKNTKYTNPITIYNRLSRKVKDKSFSKGDVIVWCGEVESEYLGEDYQLISHKDKPFDVDKDKRVVVPKNLFRLYSVTNPSGNRVVYDYNGAYIFLPDSYSDKKVLLNYEAIPLDPETGYPLILRGHEPVCEAYCLMNIYFEDYINGKLDINRYHSLQRSFEDKLMGASTGARYMDVNEKEDMIQAMYKITSPFNYPNSF